MKHILHKTNLVTAIIYSIFIIWLRVFPSLIAHIRISLLLLFSATYLFLTVLSLFKKYNIINCVEKFLGEKIFARLFKRKFLQHSLVRYIMNFLENILPIILQAISPSIAIISFNALTNWFPDELIGSIAVLISMVIGCIYLVKAAKEVSGLNWFQFISIWGVILIIGIFDRTWWGIIPIIIALSSFFYSEEAIFHFRGEIISSDSIKESIKLRWIKIKFGILFLLICFFVSILIVEAGYGFFQILIGLMNRSPFSSTEFSGDPGLALGTERIFTTGILFLVSSYLLKKIFKSTIDEYRGIELNEPMLKLGSSSLEKDIVLTEINEGSKKLNLDLLLSNSPKAFEEYDHEAGILHHKIHKLGVNNIGLVASFGAGKSSVIETYLQTYRSDKKSAATFTKISLASFNEASYEDSDVERSILQQLFYSQPKRKFKNSRIERTTETSIIWSLTLSGFVTLLLTSVLLFVMQRGVGFLENRGLPNWTFLGLAVVSFFILVVFLLYFKKFQKIVYKDFELEMKNKNGEDVRSSNGKSLINKFIDEVLYFFGCTEIDLVIFEDLDRLPSKQSSDLLMKLRDLNTIINNCHPNKKSVTFLYAVKDDMMKDQEERVKFFEFNLSISSSLNYATRRTKILEEGYRMEQASPELKLDSAFLTAITHYIPNMRTLNNTINDYVSNRYRIFGESKRGRLHNENFFALCLYRNLYPSDYSKLEQRGGIIPVLIMNKGDFIKDEIEESNKKINKWEQRLEKATQEHLKSIDELKAILKSQIYGRSKLNSGRGQWLDQIDKLESFQNFRFSALMIYDDYDRKVALSNDVRMPNGDSYYERQKIIDDKNTEKQEAIKNKIAQEEMRKQEYEKLSLKELIKLKGAEHYFDFIKNNKLCQLKNINTNSDEGKKQLAYLQFLVHNNYLDEKYMEYTSNYKSTLFSSNDEKFVKNVQEGKSSVHDKIDNVEQVFNLLLEDHFSHPTVLHYTILANLSVLKEQNEKNKKYENLKQLLNKEHSNIIITKFIQNTDIKVVREFLSHIITDMKICKRLLRGELTKEKKDLILLTLIECEVDCSAYDLQEMVSEYEGYESLLENADIEKVEKFLLAVNPLFKMLGNAENKITKFIIKHNMYEITVKNLKKLFTPIPSWGHHSFFKKNYAFITSANEELAKYINENLNVYLENVFLNKVITNEDEVEDVVIKFLNLEDITLDQQKAIVKKYEFVVERLDEYDVGLYSLMLEHNQVKPTWENILVAYQEITELSDILKECILKNGGQIEGEFKFEIEDDENEVKDISDDLFFNLANEKYSSDEKEKLRVVLGKIDFKYMLNDVFTQDDTLAVFIEEDKIAYHSDDLNILLDKSQSLFGYISHYLKEVNENFDKFFSSINSKALGKLILSKKVDRGLKQKLLINYGELLIVTGFEEEYFEVIKNNDLKITVKILNKFKNCKLDKEDQKFLVTIIVDLDNSNIQLFNEYMESLIQTLIMPIPMESDDIRDLERLHIPPPISKEFKETLQKYADYNNRVSTPARGKNTGGIILKSRKVE